MTGRGTTPVAVIGMGCRLPGGIDSPERLWESLLRGDDHVTEVPRDRWDADEYYDPDAALPGRTASKWGAFLDDIAGFDAEFFGIDERAAAALDPQHRLLLETSWEAVEHAGLTPHALAESLTGVFVGLTHFDYQLVNAGSDAMAGPYGFEGNTFGMASGRIAYSLGLHGPALTLDTACSSGLTAVHMACRSLGGGESDLALAGGAFIMLEPRKFVAGTAQSHLSPTGRCHAFDAAADGYVTGEAVAVVLLKRLADAQRDGDRILAVIRGTAANQDGRTVNFSTPSATAQTALYRAALDAAGVDAGTIGMVEAHGPGTPVGDPIEYASLSEVYGVDGPCALGSVKTNFGHTQSASGLLGLMKAILALQHGTIPRNLHFTRLPDAMARVATKLFVPQQNTPWPTAGEAPCPHPRRAAVSSYGVSGTNVHAIVEQAPDIGAAQGTDRRPSTELPFPLSSSSTDELRRSAGRLADWVRAHDEVALADLGYTLCRRRSHRPVRTAVLASSRAELTDALRRVAEGNGSVQTAVGHDDRGPVWVFSGDGSPWAGMGADLLAHEPVFAATVEQIEPLVAGESGFSVTAAMTAAEGITGIDRAQPTLFAMQVAMAATLAAHGARPGAVIGHSTGEIAAAVVAGAITLEDGVRVVCRSSRLMATLSGPGAVATVALPAKQVLSELTTRSVKDVATAVVAAPQSTVIAGAPATVRELADAWQRRDVTVHAVEVDVAMNSPQLDPIVKELAAALKEVDPLPPKVPFYSATGFDPREEPLCDNRYWVSSLRRTVRFSAAVRAALEDGYRVFAELAPDPRLVDAVEQTAHSLDIPLAVLAGMHRGEKLPHGVRDLVAQMHCAGAVVDFEVPYPDGLLVDAPLPTWTHRRLWLNSAAQPTSVPGGRTVSAHPLLGPHVRLQQQPERHVWQAEVGTADQPWLSDHRIHDAAVLPAAAYCEMAVAAARVVLGDATEVRDLRFTQSLPLDDQLSVEVSTSLSAPGVVDFVVESNRDGEHARHATAILRAAEDAPPTDYDIPALLALHPHREDGVEVRSRLEQHGVRYGPAFTGLGAAHTGRDATGSVLAEISLPPGIRSQHSAYGVHPALLEACFQSVGASPLVQSLGEDTLGLPAEVQRLRVYGPLRDARYCYTRVAKVDATGVEADLDVLDSSGAVLLSVQGLFCGVAASDRVYKDRVLSERLLTVEWQQAHLPEIPGDDAGTWLLVAASADDVLTADLCAALHGRGAQCSTMVWTLDADHRCGADDLAKHLRDRQVDGLVLVTPPRTQGPHTPRQGCRHAQHLARIAREVTRMPGRLPRLVVVTREAQTVLPGEVADLDQGALRGLLRVIGAEYPHLHTSHIDMDAATGAEQLALQLLSGSEEDESAWRNGVWYRARLRPVPLRPEERQTVVAHHECDGVGLHIRTPGDLATLEMIARERVVPGPGEIEVAVTVSSVNFADVLVAMGLYPSVDGELPELGMDFAGVVTAVGPNVTDHQVGDRVGGFSANGCWGTFVTCDARLAVPLPDGLTDHQAAAIATATATAWYGLHDLAGVASGDRVLIHSATGGVGQAAIAVARAAGAHIFATAGSEERRELLRGMGIEHVYDSRSTEFAEQIRRDTDGYGVDIVLNSLTGPAQRAGFELLAIGGRFVEIGKRDVYGNTRLGMFPFRRNLTFYYVDLALMSLSHPQRVGQLLRTIYRLAADGALPPAQHRDYPLTDAVTAIRDMGGAQHTGKLLLEIPRTGSSVVVVLPERVAVFRPDGAYLITGGLSDLGLFLAEKMADAGCGRIVLTSDTQPTLKMLETIELIRVMGGDVVVHCGDISDPATAQRAVALATATGLPLRGVLHAAAADREVMVANLTDDVIESDWAPTVHGAWNLHTALQSVESERPLDWFCSFSSTAALLGSPGRGSYAAANSWLDAFTRWRRAQGLPAVAIAWGAWGQIGRTADFAEGIGAAITPEEGAYAFEALLRHDRVHTGYAPVVGTTWLTTIAQRSPFAEAFRDTGEADTGTSRLRAVLDELPPEQWPSRLRRMISDQISLVLRRSIDPDRPLAEYGVDSLGALELRTRIETETGIRLDSSDLAVGTVRGLADLLCRKLSPTQHADNDAARA
ncbi:sulfolipid-1 biosynthesis phthioceranic/hydroxyphthioceranic acid synthase [Mycolicibacterium sp. BiH015]|uniref:sulfolipid-1 biosynthesis phthioceranic/hydroxyphthioceranic acid synthase n=1 Tax=Mycolicibacterium sp. BiH015 TaxID=3018808 RepID=UPI0022DF0D86|nr:sulfolipid-1 biosynthesis phthioceranic/hydroxyphthioceranic acid synthase [Mycolicibacterium sp. BiH015]MDA2890722.1 sulfolipid-1 biosynthesis phthioceranic/hydroxyphthioceranic acid synthase [Mycolicibacterium sp. BiH015]